MQLFGTDGIRGEVIFNLESDDEAINKLTKSRQISPRLFRLIGEGVGATIDVGATVVIGWDNRKGNEQLVANLTVGFHLRGISVIHAGEVATPGLNASMLLHKATIGCMITASHNAHSDSGIKIFDRFGFKTMPEYEREISSIVIQLSTEEREVDSPDFEMFAQPDLVIDGSEIHRNTLEGRLQVFRNVFSGGGQTTNSPFNNKIILDLSGGPGRHWNINWLNNAGFNCIGCDNPSAINYHCGAGLYSPSDAWTWDEILDCKENLLFKQISAQYSIGELKTMPKGTIIAAALDGDGDRCLIFEVNSNSSGLAVVDGDQIANTLLYSSSLQSTQKWHLATSIEADLGIANGQQGITIHTTGVGDRWLSKCLSEIEERNCDLRKSAQMPRLLGCEDSGHIVIPVQKPHNNEEWSLVGDGLATFIAYLCAKENVYSAENKMQLQFTKGWKTRVSVKESNRDLWDGKNQLANHVEKIVGNEFNRWGATNIELMDIIGENNLLFIKSEIKDVSVFLGIRNSGTEAKTNITLRLPPALNDFSERGKLLVKTLHKELVEALCNY